MTDEIWACGACRSINKAKADRCYKCRTPRAVGSVDPASLPMSASQPGPTLARPAFRSTRVLAMLASILVVAVAVLRVYSLIALGPLIERVLARQPLTQAEFDGLANLGYLSIAIPLAALVVWAFWLSRVVTVMPALDLGYPHSTGLTSFIECLIPIFNFFRVPAILRDVTRRLAPGEGRGDALIAGAWIGLIGGFILERVGGIVIGLKATSVAGVVSDSIALAGITAGLTIVGIAILVYLTWWIEARIGRRHAQLAKAAAAAATTGAPAMAAPDAATASPDDPVGPVPEPFMPAATVAAARSRQGATAESVTAGPHMRVRISGETVEASLDGTDWENVTLAELGEAAAAIREAEGAATLMATETTVASGLGRDVLEAIRASGATYTVVSG